MDEERTQDMVVSSTAYLQADPERTVQSAQLSVRDRHVRQHIRMSGRKDTNRLARAPGEALDGLAQFLQHGFLILMAVPAGAQHAAPDVILQDKQTRPASTSDDR